MFELLYIRKWAVRKKNGLILLLTTTTNGNLRWLSFSNKFFENTIFSVAIPRGVPPNFWGRGGGLSPSLIFWCSVKFSTKTGIPPPKNCKIAETLQNSSFLQNIRQKSSSDLVKSTKSLPTERGSGSFWLYVHTIGWFPPRNWSQDSRRMIISDFCPTH